MLLTASSFVSGPCIGKTNSAAAATVFMEDRLSSRAISHECQWIKGQILVACIRFSICLILLRTLSSRNILLWAGQRHLTGINRNPWQWGILPCPSQAHLVSAARCTDGRLWPWAHTDAWTGVNWEGRWRCMSSANKRKTEKGKNYHQFYIFSKSAPDKSVPNTLLSTQENCMWLYQELWLQQ